MARLVEFRQAPEADRVYAWEKLQPLLPRQGPAAPGRPAHIWLVYNAENRPVGVVTLSRLPQGGQELSANFWERGPWVVNALRAVQKQLRGWVQMTIKPDNEAARRLLEHFGARRVKYGEAAEVWIWGLTQ